MPVSNTGTLVVGEVMLEIVFVLIVALLVPCTSMPRTEKPAPVLVLVIPLMVFPVIVFEVAPSGLTKIPRKEPLLADAKVEIGLLVMLIVAPPVTDIPLTMEAGVIEVEAIFVMVFVSIETVAPLEVLIAVTTFPVLDNVDIVLFVIDLLADADESSIPSIIPEVEVAPVIVFKLMLCVRQAKVFEM